MRCSVTSWAWLSVVHIAAEKRHLPSIIPSVRTYCRSSFWMWQYFPPYSVSPFCKPLITQLPHIRHGSEAAWHRPRFFKGAQIWMVSWRTEVSVHYHLPCQQEDASSAFVCGLLSNYSVLYQTSLRWMVLCPFKRQYSAFSLFIKMWGISHFSTMNHDNGFQLKF
jgi:hypothetical protein